MNPFHEDVHLWLQHDDEEKPKALHHITRIDTSETAEHPTVGWQVRARRQGRRYTKFFSDGSSGSWTSSLEEALSYREELLRTAPEKVPQEEALRRAAAARSTTGVPGLSVSEQDIGNGTRKPYVLVSTGAPPKRETTKYSVEKHGLAAALRKGCQWLAARRDKSSEELLEEVEVPGL